jgi:hypothetical protein
MFNLYYHKKATLDGVVFGLLAQLCIISEPLTKVYDLASENLSMAFDCWPCLKTV